MGKDEMSQILSDHLAQYRCWTYERLVAHVDRGRLGHSSATSADGTPYQLSFDAVWDDRPGGNVRVLGDLSAEPQLRHLVGKWKGVRVRQHKPEDCSE